MPDLIRVRVQLPHGDAAQFARVGPGWTSLTIREGTSDEDVIDEVFVADVYRIRGLAHETWPASEHHPGATVIDLGANIGVFSALCLQYGAAQVIAVEPEVGNLALLRRNLMKWNDRVRVYPAAVGADHRTLTMVGDGATGHTMLGGEGTINPVTIADILADIDGNVALLKCDIEGAEYQAFLCCPSEQLARVDRIAMEWHGPETCPWLASGEGVDNDLDAWVFARYGELVAHLAYTHAVTVFGTPDRGGMLFAHRYDL